MAACGSISRGALMLSSVPFWLTECNKFHPKAPTPQRAKEPGVTPVREPHAAQRAHALGLVVTASPEDSCGFAPGASCDALTSTLFSTAVRVKLVVSVDCAMGTVRATKALAGHDAGGHRCLVSQVV